MRYRPLYLFIFAMVVQCASQIYDQSPRVQLTENVKVYDGPGYENKVIATISGGSKLILLDERNDWQRVRVSASLVGWVNKSQTSRLDFQQVRIISNTKVRRGPGEQYKAFAILVAGKTFKVSEEKNNWYYVILPDGNTGWINRADTEKLTHKNVTTTTETRLREAPNSSSREMMRIKKGEELVQLEQQGSWYRIELSNGMQGWIHESAVQTVPERNISVPEAANIRKGPAIHYDVIEKVSANQRLTELEQQGDWYKVRTPSGKIGWVYSKVVKRTETERWSDSGDESKEVSPSYAVSPAYIMTNQDGKIRQGYSTDFQVLEEVKTGTILLKIGKRNDWLRIKFPPNGQIGWIRSDLVTSTVDLLFTNQECNIRRGYGLDFPVVRRVSAATPLARIGLRDNWFRVHLPDGEIGWVRNDLIIAEKDVAITNQESNFRSGAGLSYAEIGRLPTGSILTALKRQGEWIQVREKSDRTGWIRVDLLSTIYDYLETFNEANLHSAPASTSSMVKRLSDRTRMFKISSQNDWVEVRTLTSSRGWLRSSEVLPAYMSSSGISIASEEIYMPSSRSSLMTIQQTNIRLGPGLNYPIIKTIDAGTELIRISQEGEWYEVKLPDGTLGYVHSSVFSSSGAPFESSSREKLYTRQSVNVRKGPDSTTALITRLPSGTSITKLDQREDWTYVLTGNGRRGWIYTPLLSSPKKVASDIRIEDVTVEHGLLHTIDRLSVRSGPGDQFRVVQEIPTNRKLTKKGSYQDWFYVQFDGDKFGYVPRNTVEDATIRPIITVEQAKVMKIRDENAESVGTMAKGTVIKPMDAIDGWYAVTTETGAGGWIRSDDIKPVRYPKIFAKAEANVRRGPTTTAQFITRLNEGDQLEPIDEQKDWYFVLLPDGNTGWVSKKVVTHQSYPKIKITKTTKAYVHPSITTEAIATLMKGDEFYPSNKQGEWYQIFLRGGDLGWVYSSFYEEKISGNLLIKQKTDIREGPGEEYKVIESARPGKELKCLEEDGPWCQVISSSGKVGWMNKEASRDISFKPIVTIRQTQVRTGPGENYMVIETVAQDKQYIPTDEREGWYEIKLSETRRGWMRKSDLLPTDKKKIVFTLDLSQIRGGPGESYAVKRRVDPATDLMVIGEQGEWYNVKGTTDGMEGWIKKDLVFE